MTYRFHSKAAGDVLMIEPVGAAVLAAMGIALAPRGIIEPAAIPAALRAIDGLLAHSEASPAAAATRADDEDNDDVSLLRRA